MKNDTLLIQGHTDIYLIDQIMKGRYKPADIILDAGCGSGRNLHWFIQNDYTINGIDSDEVAIGALKNHYPDQSNSFSVAAVERTGFSEHHFDHIICCAVLHFANDTAHFKSMLCELFRILKPGGTLFIRMASDIGIESRVKPIGSGVFIIPDNTARFLLTRQLLAECVAEYGCSFAEPIKTTNVADERCMSTLVLQSALS